VFFLKATFALLRWNGGRPREKSVMTILIEKYGLKKRKKKVEPPWIF
jgi:hypothetical protein